MTLRIDNFGPDALMVRHAVPGEAAAFARGQALLRYVQAHPLPGLREATPGFTTLLLEFERGTRPDPRSVHVVLTDALRAAGSEPVPGRRLELPVIYDGPDLLRVADHAGLSVERTIELHARGEYRVHLLGFSPGFPYLSGLDARLQLPRRETPRLRVPAGSVGIGGEHTGVYPVATAGGWNLIGRTNAPLLDASRARAGSPDAFVLQPGDSVRFVSVNHF